MKPSSGNPQKRINFNFVGFIILLSVALGPLLLMLLSMAREDDLAFFLILFFSVAGQYIYPLMHVGLPMWVGVSQWLVGALIFSHWTKRSTPLATILWAIVFVFVVSLLTYILLDLSGMTPKAVAVHT